MSRRLIWRLHIYVTGALLLCVLPLTQSKASAAVDIAVSWEAVGEYDESFNFVSPTPSQTFPGHFFELHFRFTMTGLAADEDFAIANIDLPKEPNILIQPGSASVMKAVDFGAGLYSPLGGSYDSNGVEPGGIRSHWGTINADPVGNDLRGIVIGISASEAGNRQYGESPRPGAGSADWLGFPTRFGTVIYQTTSAGAGGIPFYAMDLHVSVNQLQIWRDNTIGGGGSLVTIPEPSACAFLGLVMISLRRRRRPKCKGF